jgi:hypothetical protein
VMIKLKYAITKMELLSSPSKAFRQQFLLLQTADGGYWKALLEQEASKNKFETIFTHYYQEMFFPVSLSKFTQVKLSKIVFKKIDLIPALVECSKEQTGSYCCLL